MSLKHTLIGGALINGRSLEIMPMEIGDQTINPTPKKKGTVKFFQTL